MSDLIRREELLDYLQMIPIDLGYREIEDVVTFVEKMKSVNSVEVVRCKDCMHRVVNEHYGEQGYLNIKAMCELDTGDVFELGRNAANDDWFCADAERLGVE